jgi:hypothetical protein
VAGAAESQPGIITRAQWGANENLRLANCPDGPDYDANVNLAIVHHTDGSNNYGPADSAAMMRGLYAYATQTLQYCDMHYNFLVDKYGQIFEGRYGGVRAAVHGAHSVGWNTNTTGIATMGNFQVTPPPPAMVASLERLIAWKFDVHGVNPTTPFNYVTAGNEKFAAGTAVLVPRIIGHQDTWYTDCPGVYLEAQLPAIRATVTALMAGSRHWSVAGSFGGSVSGAASAASWAPNREDVFAVDNGSLVHKWGDGDYWSAGWEDLGRPSVRLVGAPASVSWAPGRIDVFARGSDGTLRHKWYDKQWSSWENLGGHLISAPTVTTWGVNRLDVFGTGPGGVLMHKWWNNAWSGWESLGGGVVGDPAAVSWAAGRIDVFVRGTDNGLWHRWYVGGWTGWEGLGGALTSGPSVASWQPDRIDVFVRGTDRALWHKWWAGGWSPGYEFLGGSLTNKPAAISKSWNRIDVFTRAGDRVLHHGLWGCARFSASRRSGAGARRARSGSPTAERGGEGAEQDPQVAPEAHRRDVLEVDVGVEVHQALTTLGHLPEAGDPGTDQVPLTLPRRVAIHDFHQLRPGSDQAHVAAHDVPQLRQLVQAPRTEPATEARVTRVARTLVRPAPLFDHRRGPRPAIGQHRAELQHGERHAVAADAALAEQDRAADRCEDGHRDGEQHRQEQHEEEQPDDAIEHRLADPRVERRRHDDVRMTGLPVRARVGPRLHRPRDAHGVNVGTGRPGPESRRRPRTRVRGRQSRPRTPRCWWRCRSGDGLAA